MYSNANNNIHAGIIYFKEQMQQAYDRWEHSKNKQEMEQAYQEWVCLSNSERRMKEKRDAEVK